MSAPRLLVFAQTVDLDDPVLGFFHGWLAAFAGTFPHIHAVCLKVGRHALPGNVVVHTLGKERGAGRFAYVWRVYQLAWSLRREYDAVFVHMNPEYVVLGGLLWRLMGKRVYLWRNHWSKGMLTDIAVALSHKTFCTSKSSYIAKYRKNMLMPVGIDTEVFRPIEGIERKSRSLLSLGRIAPSKNINIVLDALRILKESGIELTASIYGDALPKDADYLSAQKKYVAENGLSGCVSFYSGVKNAETPAIYSSHGIFVNASGSGMFDKTMLEALVCGALTLASSTDYADMVDQRLVFLEGDAGNLALKLQNLLTLPTPERNEVSLQSRRSVENAHSLRALVARLASAM